MKFRDSSGRVTNNPFNFLQQTKKYPIKKVKELTDIEKAEIEFELDYMVTDFLNEKCLSKIIMEYFPHFCKKYNLNIKISETKYFVRDNYTGRFYIPDPIPTLYIELKVPAFNFKEQITNFLNLFITPYKHFNVYSENTYQYFIRLYPRSRGDNSFFSAYRMMYGY